MFHWCLLLVILLIILIKDFKKPLIEGIDHEEETGDEDTTDGTTDGIEQEGIDDGQGGMLYI